jgi:release factor glutamine methyltransferase
VDRRLSTEFGGLSLATSPGRVMTPRATSEALVAAAVAAIGGAPARVVDVGTGSGAIALAIAAAASQAEIWATDTSAAAVALARANARRVGLDERVFVRQGDLLDPVHGRFDVVVANLPYLPLADAASEPGLAAEPAEAVFAADDGLGPYRRLLTQIPGRLTPDGAVLIQLRRRVLSARAGGLDELAAAVAPVADAA